MKAVALLILAATFAGPAMADTRPDKIEIIDSLANRLVKAYREQFKGTPVKPRVFIAEVASSATSLDQNDVALLVDKVDVLLSSDVEVLDREKLAVITNELSFQQSGEVTSEQVVDLGKKHGASQIIFIAVKDQVGRVSQSEEHITVNAKITAIDVKTSGKIVNGLVTVEVDHERFSESYIMRDSASFVLSTIAFTGAVGAVGFGYKTYTDKQSYDGATSSGDAVKWRQATVRDQTITIGAAGVGITALVLRYFVNAAPRNADSYSSYEVLSLLSPSKAPALAATAAWRLP